MFITNQDLKPWIKEILEHATPASRDKELLNELSCRQIVDSSYLENVLPTIAFDANFIVPQSLHECKLNQVWRYPPHLYCDFLIKSNGNTTIKILARLAIPRFMRYGERKYFKGEKREAVSKHASTNPTIKLSKDFGCVKLFGTTYQLDYDGQLKPKTVKPFLFEHTEEINLNEILKTGKYQKIILNQPEEKIVVKKFDAKAKEVQVADPNNELNDLGYEPIKKVDEKDVELGYIELVYGPSKVSFLISAAKTDMSDVYKVSIRLINDIEYKKDVPKTSEWTRRSIILPHMFITIVNGIPIIPLQQHYESIEYIVKNGEQRLAKDYDEQTFTQINGVLTRSVKDKNTLCFSMFGVYDTIKELPEQGPAIDTLLKNDKSFFDNLDRLTAKEKEKLQSENNYLPIIKAILRAAANTFNVTKNLYKFQWDAIQNRLKIILNNEEGTTTIVKAPTATGKTLVFMVDAALHSILRKQRSVLVFPTRILNEDMFRRLTKFVYEMRKEIQNTNISGGIYIGYSDPLYNALANPTAGKVMIQFDVCPACGSKGSIIATESNNRKIGKCSNEKCEHEITYMFGPKEVPDYLPLITIATPDNLFYYSTNAGWEQFNMRFFGGYYVKCLCGYCEPFMNGRNQQLECRKCHATLSPNNRERSPIGYFVFDEVHSLYGLTGILLSIYLKAVDIVANKIGDYEYFKKPLQWESTFETGTATIANEVELLQAITRVPNEKIRIVPQTKDYFNYFKPEPDLVKYRTIVMLPVARAARTSVSNALLRLYHAIHLDSQFSGIINSKAKNAYDFILGYLFRKSDGYTLRRTIRDLASQELGEELNVEFLSGDSTTAMVAKLFQMAVNKEVKILLANLVISLGIDISNMNNIIMMGLPKSMTEFVQTAGRTGRGTIPGHVVVHLLPSNPRDMYVFENFHRVFSDVSGYYEMKPIQSTNAYAAKIVFPNILKFMLSAHSYHQYVLTTPSVSRFFSNDGARKAIMLDVLKALTDASNPESLKNTIFNETRQAFEEYVLKWSKISGPQNYLAEWFKKDGHILTTLRERTNKEIVVQIDDMPLLDKIEEQFKPPWASFPEEEVQDNDSDEEEE